MSDDRILVFEPEVQRGLTRYIRQHFAPEDDLLRSVRASTPEKGLPQIEIRPEEGKMLQFLVALSSARRVLEIGTLAGYSGIWLARGLPEGGTLITLELDPKHAEVAREHFKLAGVSDRIEIMVGNAHESLQKLASEAPFDMVFIDAEKEGYPAYLDWAVAHVPSGGLITAHNAFRGGAIVDDGGDERVTGTRAFLEAMAQHARLFSTIIPVGDGIAAAVVK
ncbi:MAG: O-methyltransferase [Chloroflexi bacterium]|nr:O-methyltransferase [Chloroflexota bacterium]